MSYRDTESSRGAEKITMSAPDIIARGKSNTTHKKNYTHTTRELAGWLAGRITTREPVMRLAGYIAGWLAGGLAGCLAEAQRGPERPREAERG